MKKSLLALAVFGAFASAAQADTTNIQIYGVVDIGYVKESGRDWRLADYDNNRIGFKGTEDLGGGYKAVFDLQKRFDLNDGTSGNSNTAGFTGSKGTNQKEYEGAANVGLVTPYGSFRAGRINQIETENIRKFDPFNQIGVGSQIYGLQRNARIDNTFRYDSPNLNGFTVKAAYSLGNNTNSDSATNEQKALKKANADNDGYEIGLLYDNGAFSGTANWARVADSNDSKFWSLGLAYKVLDNFQLKASYEDNDSRGYKGGQSGTSESTRLWGRQRNLLVGFNWNVGPGVIAASVQYDRLGNTRSSNDGKYHAYSGDKDAIRYAVGYTHNLSKRTSLYGNLAYTDYDDKEIGYRTTGLRKDSVTAFQAGIQHKF